MEERTMSDELNTPATTPEAPVEGAATAALPVEAVQDAAPATAPENPPATAPEAPVETAPVAEAPVETAPASVQDDGQVEGDQDEALRADDEAQPTRHSKRTAA
jgi:hypothetical protein